MNLFTPKLPESKPIPTIDEAQQRIDQLRRGRALTGRASAMLAAGQQQPSLAKQVTGN